MQETNHLTAQEASLQPFSTYRDRIFRLIFKEKDKLLELYNAMNGTSYSDPADLTVTTLENALYMNMKNDVSFVLDNRLNLYEHQTTNNPNMPLRDLFYVANIYSALTKDKYLYGSRLIQIPSPKFVVFYNGKTELPERTELKLSDAYIPKGKEICLELKVEVLNINLGHNKELAEKCRTLHEYMQFVDKVREYSREMPFKEAVEKAIGACIANDILAEFLQKNRAEVLNLSIFEYDEEKHMRQVREEAVEYGYADGYAKGEQSGYAKGEQSGYARGEQSGYAKGEQSGYTKGKQSGYANCTEQIVLRMLENGLSDEDILKLTEITRERLRDIRAQKEHT